MCLNIPLRLVATDDMGNIIKEQVTKHGHTPEFLYQPLPLAQPICPLHTPANALLLTQVKAEASGNRYARPYK